MGKQRRSAERTGIPAAAGAPTTPAGRPAAVAAGIAADQAPAGAHPALPGPGAAAVYVPP
ncbi:MAG: hypothetical protein AVDCRST_MAG41-3395, partial [uncultured Corynebacteriales bacterium]